MARRQQKPVSEGETFELELEAMANGGSAMGWHGDKAVFVPFTIPGERIVARVVEDRGRFARAEGVTLLEASADRVFPRCPHFGPGRCGHCQWQHIDYPAQLLLKQDVLADQLARLAGLDDANVQPVIPAPEVWGYNYHMTMLVREDGRLGLASVDGRHVEPITECYSMHPDLYELYQSLDLEGFEGVRRVQLRLGTDGGWMIVLSMAEDAAPELETDLPMSVNILLPDNEPVNLIGESHSRYEVSGHHFRVTAGSAFRSNVGQLPALAQTVLQLLDLHGDEAVLDLYAGVGFFSAFLAEHAALVTLAESYPPAATDADENLDAYDHVDVIEGGVEAVLEAAEEQYQAAVLDPPSSGINDAVARLLAERSIERLAYVSSDPASLAHDCKRLAKHGYGLALAQPLDLAPHTPYIDTVALFTR